MQRHTGCQNGEKFIIDKLWGCTLWGVAEDLIEARPWRASKAVFNRRLVPGGITELTKTFSTRPAVLSANLLVPAFHFHVSLHDYNFRSVHINRDANNKGTPLPGHRLQFRNQACVEFIRSIEWEGAGTSSKLLTFRPSQWRCPQAVGHHGHPRSAH